MQDDSFGNWLKNVDDRPLPQIRDNLARTRRVEYELQLDLDEEYQNGRCESVLDTLDVTNSVFLSKTSLPTDMAGLSSLKTAVRKYVKFRDWQNIHT